MQRVLSRNYLLLLLGCSASMVGCGQPAPAAAPTKPPEVEVCLPVRNVVTDQEDFTGQTEAMRTIDVRARVTGYLDNVAFKDGAIVEKGAPLFEIDPRPYEAELQRSEANVAQSVAHLERLNADFDRAQNLQAKGVMTREAFDLVAADRAEAKAVLAANEATRSMARLNLEFTRIGAPISGQLGRRFIDAGNLVKGDETILTRIVSLDPIYVYFDVDERTMLRIRRSIPVRKSDSSRSAESPVLMGLADEEGHPHPGTINFEDNRLDPGTGTLQIRAVFPNPERLLVPGLFVRVRVPVGEPREAILVPEQALGTDQGQRFLFVVNDKSEVVYRPVKVGRLHESLRVITDGLTMGERVVVSGLQRVRPGVKVTLKRTATAPGVAAASRMGPAPSRARENY